SCALVFSRLISQSRRTMPHLLPQLTASTTQNSRRLRRKFVDARIPEKVMPKLRLSAESSSLNTAQSVTGQRQKVERRRQACGLTKCNRRRLAACFGYLPMVLFVAECQSGRNSLNRSAGQ